MEVLNDQRLLKTYLLIHRWRPHCVSSRGKRGEGALRGPFYKTTDPIHEGSTFMTPQRPHL